MVKKIYSFALLCMFMLVATAAQAYTVVADPADKSVLTKLEQIVLTFDGAAMVDQGSAANDITITSSAASVNCTLDFGTSDNQMVVNFAAISEAGEYTVNVPAAAFSVDGADSEAFTLTYTISKDGVDPNLTLIPAAGETVGWLSRIIYQYAGPTNYLYAPYPNKTVQLLDKDGNVVCTGTAKSDNNLKAGQGSVELTSVITTPGEYTLVIPDSAFYSYNAGTNAYYPGVTATYTVTGEGLDEVKLIPSEEVYKIETFGVVFPNETIVKAAGSAYVYLWRDNYEYSVGGFYPNQSTIDGNTVMWKPYSPFVTPDHYYATVPEGAFLLGEEERPSSPFTIEFTIIPPKAVAYTITPATDSTPKTLRTFTMTFPEKETITSVNNSITLQHGTKFIGGAYTSNNAFKIDGNSVEFTLNNVATEAGEYKLIFPANQFSFSDGTFTANDTITFNISGCEAVKPVAVSPKAGETVARLQDFTFTFPEAKKVEVVQGLSSTNAILNRVGTYESIYCYRIDTLFQRIDDVTFSLHMPKAGVLAGDYTLVLPANIFIADGENYSVADTITFTADGTGIDKVQVYPTMDEPIAEFPSAITLTYLNETSISLATQYPSASLVRRKTGDEAYDSYPASFNNKNITCEGNVLSFGFTDYSGNPIVVNTKGSYYMNIGTSSTMVLLTDGSDATPQSLEWVVDPEVATGIADMNKFAAVKNAATFNLLGRRVSNDFKGIVVKNGKKMLVK